MTLHEIISLIDNQTPFAFSRWGDGEWRTITGGRDGKGHGGNCDGNFYYDDLGERLEEIVSGPVDYYMAAQLSDTLMSKRRDYDHDWNDADIFHKASIKRQLQPFIECLHRAHVVYVGNESLGKLPFIDEFVEIPYKNVWRQYDQALARILAHTDGKGKTFCVSAGMAANVFIHDLWQAAPNHCYMDVGSVFDPYVGRLTRTYHHDLELP